MPKPTTPIGRFSFPALFKPRENNLNPGAEPKYEVTLLFDKDDPLTVLREAARAAVKEKWGDKPPKNLRSPFRDGDEKDLDGYEGTTYVSFKSKVKPGVCGPKMERIDADDSPGIYAGAYGRVSFSCYAYDANGNRGVAFGLGNVQKTGDGEPFGGMNTSTDDDFAAVEAVSSNVSDDDLI